jgi:hypothetical protein
LKLTRRHKALGGAAAAGLAGAVALAFAVPALAGDTTTIEINPGNVPTTAAGFSKTSCDQVPGSTPDWLDGWVFVLPESVKAEGNFDYIEAVYQDEGGNVLRFNTADDGGIVSGSGNNKAYIITPAGLTLIDAQAEVELKEDDGKENGKDKEPQFNLTHTCPATEDEPEPTTSPEESSPAEEPSSPGEEPSSPGEEPSSPGEEPSSPGEEPSSPGEDPSSPDAEPSSPGESSPAESSPAESSPAATSSAPGEASTSPAGGGQLPTTGSPLTYVLVGAAALLAAGIVLLVILRRRTEPGEGA